MFLQEPTFAFERKEGRWGFIWIEDGNI